VMNEGTTTKRDAHCPSPGLCQVQEEEEGEHNRIDK
jgi:hypothetical protein